MPALNLEVDFVKTTADVAHMFFRFGLIWFVFTIARSITGHGHSNGWLCYLSAIAVCTVIALFARSNLGTHTEEDDPMFGGGHLEVDYVPTKKARDEHFLWVFEALTLPSLVGVYSGLELRRKNQQAAISFQNEMVRSLRESEANSTNTKNES